MEEKFIEFIEFTDPICTWCWGSEPLLRKLETRFKDNIRIKFIMGGLVKDIREFYDGFNNIGGDAIESNKQIAMHWVEASERHGMPVNNEGFELFSNEYNSSYPQNIAFKAAQMENEELAIKFLRNMREASETQARKTNRLEVLIEIANETGLDVAKFIERFTDGSAEKLFYKDLEVTQQYEVRGFPTFLVKYGDQKILLRGYQQYETVKAVIKSLTGDAISETIPSKDEDSVIEFIKNFGNVAPIEIKTTFDFTDDDMNSLLDNLMLKNLIKKIPVGNGYFLQLASNQMICDIDTGMCNI